MQREMTATQAEQFGAVAPITPLVLEIPLRGGRFTAQVRIPLDVTVSELYQLCAEVLAHGGKPIKVAPAFELPSMQSKRFIIVPVHGEGRSLFNIVDTTAPSDEQPCVIQSFERRDAAERAVITFTEAVKV